MVKNKNAASTKAGGVEWSQIQVLRLKIKRRAEDEQLGVDDAVGADGSIWECRDRLQMDMRPHVSDVKPEVRDDLVVPELGFVAHKQIQIGVSFVVELAGLLPSELGDRADWKRASAA